MPYIDIHVIQTLAPNNMNRDDSGSPKTALVSGVQRQRLSSQSQKAAVRRRLEETMPAGVVGIRSRRLIEEVADRATALTSELTREQIIDSATDLVLEALGDKGEKPSEKTGEVTILKTLAFLSHAQLNALAELAADPATPGLEKKQLTAKLNGALAAENSVDQALFGRMLAARTKHSIDGAASVAHAISVDRAQVEYDYYTGTDDLQHEDTAAAGMMGTIEFIQSTVYRKADINVGLLGQNLAADDAQASNPGAAAAAFVHAFLTTLPTGKKTTFAHASLPDVVMVTFRDDLPVNLSAAFSYPVEAVDGKSVAEIAGQRLVSKAAAFEKAYSLKPANTVSLSVVDGLTMPGQVDSISDVLTAVENFVNGHLS